MSVSVSVSCQCQVPPRKVLLHSAASWSRPRGTAPALTLQEEQSSAVLSTQPKVAARRPLPQPAAMSRPPPGPRLHPAHWPLGASGLAGQLLALLLLLALRAVSGADCPCQEPKLCLPISHHPDYEVSAASSSPGLPLLVRGEEFYSKRWCGCCNEL